jgi:hypothetical protein
MGYTISLYFKLTLKEHEMICKEIKHTKDSTNILVDLLNSSKVITKIRDNYLKEYSSYLKLMEAPNYPGVYHIEMYRDYIDETIKTKLSRIFSFIKPSTYRKYVNMANIGLSELTKYLTLYGNELEQFREEILLNLGFLLILELDFDNPLALRDTVIDNYFDEVTEFKLNCLLYCLLNRFEAPKDKLVTLLDNLTNKDTLPKENDGKYTIRDLFGLDFFDVEKFAGRYELRFHVTDIVDNKLSCKFILSKYGLLFSLSNGDFLTKEKAFEIELDLNSNKETIFLNQLKTIAKDKRKLDSKLQKLNPKLGVIGEDYHLNTDIRNLRDRYEPSPYIEFINKVDDWFIRVNDLVNPKIYCIPDNNIEATEVKENGIIYTIIKNLSYNQEIKLMCRMSDIPFLNTK